MSELEHNSEDRIRSAFKERDWNEIKSADSWAIFKVMAEFVEGFDKLAKIGPCVTIFGSARTPRDHAYYKVAEEIAAYMRALGDLTEAEAMLADPDMKALAEAAIPALNARIREHFHHARRPKDDHELELLRAACSATAACSFAC